MGRAAWPLDAQPRLRGRPRLRGSQRAQMGARERAEVRPSVPAVERELACRACRCSERWSTATGRRCRGSAAASRAARRPTLRSRSGSPSDRRPHRPVRDRSRTGQEASSRRRPATAPSAVRITAPKSAPKSCLSAACRELPYMPFTSVITWEKYGGRDRD